MEEFQTRLEQAKLARKETLAKYRMEKVKELPEPLPISGLRVWVRDVTMMDLVLSGKLPEPLVDVIEQLEKSGVKEFDLKQIARNGKEFAEMVDGLVMIATVEPPIADAPDDDHLGIAELPGEDRMAIYGFLNREVQHIKSFRNEGKPVEAAQPSGDIQPATE